MLRALLRNDPHRLCEEQVGALSGRQVAEALCNWATEDLAPLRALLLGEEDQRTIQANSHEGTLRMAGVKERYQVRGTDGKMRPKARQVRAAFVLRRRCNAILRRSANDATTIG